MDIQKNNIEIKNLNNELINKGNIIAKQLQNINYLQNEVNKLKNFNNIYFNNNYNIIQSLKNNISKKDQIIMNLQKNLQNNNYLHRQKVYKDDLISVQFISTDGSLHYSEICEKDEIFAEAEEKLYKIYPKYRETTNNFLYDGKIILRFKTIRENNIKSGFPITLYIPS